MEPLYLVVIGIIVLGAVIYFFVSRKSPQQPEIEARPEERKLPQPAQQQTAPKPVAQPVKPTAPEKPVAPKPARPVEAPRKLPDLAGDEAEDVSVEADEPVKAAPPAPPVAPAKPVAPEAPARPAAREAVPTSTRKRDVEGLRKGLSKVREKEGFFGRLKALFTGKKEIDPQIVEQIEEVLLTSDVGVKTTELLLSEIKSALQKNELADEARVWQALREHAAKILGIGGGGIVLSAKPTVVMFVGVNGVGKTTTIGKLATKLKADNKKVVLAAGDTFRAAAVQQLVFWGKRIGVEVVSGKDGANPGAVIFDAIQRAKEIGADVVLADTAGRLHTKANLMEELTKVSRTMAKAFDGAPHETLLVLDATNGQNALAQAAMFKEALPISGIVLTKLDGTAKGGVILGICAEHQLPVRYIGIGERAEDLRDFVPEEFVEAMLGQGDT